MSEATNPRAWAERAVDPVLEDAKEALELAKLIRRIARRFLGF